MATFGMDGRVQMNGLSMANGMSLSTPLTLTGFWQGDIDDLGNTLGEYQANYKYAWYIYMTNVLLLFLLLLIGTPINGMDMIDFVLSKFNEEEIYQWNARGGNDDCCYGFFCFL